MKAREYIRDDDRDYDSDSDSDSIIVAGMAKQFDVNEKRD